MNPWSWALCAVAWALCQAPAPAARLGVARASRGRRLRASLWVVGSVLATVAVVGRLSVALSTLVAVGVAWWWLRARREGRARREENAATCAFIEALQGQLRAGVAPAEALGTASSAHPCKAAERLQEVAVGAQPQDRIGVLWAAATSHGIALSSLLEAEYVALKAGERQEAKAQAELAGAKATATMLALLPLAGVGLGGALGARPLAFLGGGGLGGVVLVCGTALLAAGTVWTHVLIHKAAGVRA